MKGVAITTCPKSINTRQAAHIHVQLFICEYVRGLSLLLIAKKITFIIKAFILIITKNYQLMLEDLKNDFFALSTNSRVCI